MLDMTPAGLQKEQQASEQWMDKHLEQIHHRVQRYHGPHYDETGERRLDPENHDFEFVALMLPQCAYNNPRARVTSRRTGPTAEVAEAYRHALNRLQRDQNKCERLSPWIVDVFFNHGATVTTCEPNEMVSGETLKKAKAGMKLPNSEVIKPSIAKWPVTRRIAMDRVGWDPQAEELDTVRFVWHKYVRDQKDLEEQAKNQPKNKLVGKWNREVLKGLGTDNDDRKKLRKDEYRADRDQVVLVEMWVPEADPKDFGIRVPEKDKDLYHGMIFTFSHYSGARDIKEGKWVREPFPFYGPRWGPYSITGYLPVPGDTVPLAPLCAVEGQVRDLNDQARACTRAMQQYKRMGVVDGSDEEFATMIQHGKHGHVYPHAALSSLQGEKYVEVQVGGIDAVMLEQKAQTRDVLDRVSGIHDVQRGNVSGDATATEVAVASSASAGRTEWLKKQIGRGFARQMKTEAWYLWAEERVAFPLGPEVARDMGLEEGAEPWFFGGDRQNDVNFDDLEFEVEPYSLERVDDQQVQARAIQAHQLKVQAAQLMVQMPWLNWEKEMEFLGNSLNIPDFGKDINYELANQVAAMMLQAGQLPQAQEEPQTLLRSHAAGSTGNGRQPGQEATSVGRMERGPAGLPGQQSGAQAARERTAK